MEKKLNLVAYIRREYLTSLLKEAFKITIRNGRLVLFITCIMFSCYCLKELADHLCLEPVLENLATDAMLLSKKGASRDTSKFFLKDLRLILAYRFVVWLFLCVVLVFSVAASVHSTNEAYTAKVLGLKEMLTGLKGKVWRPFKTNIWMTLITLASACLLAFTIGFVGTITEGSAWTNLTSVVKFLGGLYYVQVFALWMVSLVVSVLEENFSGLKAIYRANELMKGKRLKGFGLMFLMILVIAAMLEMFALLVSATAGKEAPCVGWGIQILRIWPYCLLMLFVCAVYTLFYHECKKSHEEVEITYVYAPVAATAEV